MNSDRRIARGGLRAALLGGVAATLLATTAAAEQRPISFDIAAQDAGSALNDFSRQSGMRVLFPYDAVEGKQVPALRGDMTVDAALLALLKTTGLVVAANDGTTVTLTDPQSGSAAGGGAEVEALIVTAQKREEDIQDVPIAISAFTQEDLTRSQIAGGPDLITQVPNMTFTKTNFSSYSVQLRGIGTQAISATTDPAVAVAFNNTPFIRNRFFEQEFYDLQRVEVLRGPQGTLYGRNATAGVVNIISAKPRHQFEAKASGDLSNYKSSRVEGMVNLPLVEDIVALRLAGAWTKREGYAVNELTGNPIDGRDLWSTRLSLRVTPTDRLDVNLIWEHFEEEDDRLRSGKQLCKKHVVTQVGDVPITNYFDTSVAGGQGSLWAGVQGTLSQGCERNSLYAQGSFQRPNGLMLPYYGPIGSVGLPTGLYEPYVSPFAVGGDFPAPLDPALVIAYLDQPQDLRVIQSTLDPKYTAQSDIGELQFSFDVTDTLTLSSETAYAVDHIYSMQDFNRFNTAPGAWGGMRSERVELFQRGVLQLAENGNAVFCDPQLGCSDRLVAVDVSTAESAQFSQEFRIGTDFEGPFNFSLGANYLRYDTEDKYYVFINSLTLTAANNGRRSNNDATTPYIGGVTDNSHCLINGYAPGDSAGVFPVIGCTYIDPNPIDRVNDKGHNYFLSKNPYKLISYAVFGEAYYQLRDNLKVTAGLRWTVDKKEAPRVPTWLLASQSVGYPVAEVIEQEWREPTGRLALDWKPELAWTDETMIYGSYAHGYKAGGANPPGFVRVFYGDPNVATTNSNESATRPKTFVAEFVDAFEVGAKNTLANGAVTLNLAAFYYDYKDYQISEIVDRSAFNRNFDATVWGIEVEADWRPLENFRLGFKGGYESARFADGEQAIDLMDRTAGDPNWLVVRPFPTFASSCIIPTYVFENPDGTLAPVGGVGGGGPGACELAYQMGLDPVTAAPYVDLAAGETPGPAQGPRYLADHPGYPGFDPATAPNGGEGIMKDISGNPLPNAPDWTATITADYSIPLPNEWLATLHTDLHWQSESNWRVFDDHEFSKLDEYFTMNLAAIFVNEERGWNIMAYIKNVTDETAITGAFLNSDDTGLTTNVFLTEPRLYGLRVTKAWSGGPLLGSFGKRSDGPYPFELELGGQLQQHEAENAILQPSFGDLFDGSLAVLDDAQNADLDWGDGREVKLIWRPDGGPWKVIAGVRGGETNAFHNPITSEKTPPICLLPNQALCANPEALPIGFRPYVGFQVDNLADAAVTDQERHTLVDLMVGHELSLGPIERSTFSAGLRRASFDSVTNAQLRGTPDWVVQFSFAVAGSRTLYRSELQADRQFDGFGPAAEWEAAIPVIDLGDGGAVNLDWTLGGGMLFGEREAGITLAEAATRTQYTIPQIVDAVRPRPLATAVPLTTLEPIRRTENAEVPFYGARLGVSYEVGGFKLGAGYRWERYVDAIDGGFEEAEPFDRTIDGPYFKIAVGFGG